MIVLNKTDLVTPRKLAEVEAQIRSDQPLRHHPPHAALGRGRSPTVLDRGAFDLGRILEAQAGLPDRATEHEHDDDIASMSFEVERPIDPEKFNAWISHVMLAEKGQDLLRTKGILTLCRARARRFAFQAVHMIADGDFIGPWPGRRTAALPPGVHRPQPQPPATAPRVRGVPSRMTLPLP